MLTGDSRPCPMRGRPSLILLRYCRHTLALPSPWPVRRHGCCVSRRELEVELQPAGLTMSKGTPDPDCAVTVGISA